MCLNYGRGKIISACSAAADGSGGARTLRLDSAVTDVCYAERVNKTMFSFLRRSREHAEMQTDTAALKTNQQNNQRAD